MGQALAQAFGQVLDPTVLTVIALAAVYGTLYRSPGLSATMAVALIVPLTYFLSPLAALAAVITLEACAISAGDIPSALVRIPGTPASAAYADDLYHLAQRGQYERALGVCITFSVIGGLFGVAVLILFARPFAGLATLFTVVEYFWLYVLGLGCAVVVSRGSALKGAFALLVGLLLSTVGLSPVHTAARFTFDRPESCTRASASSLRSLDCSASPKCCATCGHWADPRQWPNSRCRPPYLRRPAASGNP